MSYRLLQLKQASCSLLIASVSCLLCTSSAVDIDGDSDMDVLSSSDDDDDDDSISWYRNYLFFPLNFIAEKHYAIVNGVISYDTSILIK